MKILIMITLIIFITITRIFAPMISHRMKKQMLLMRANITLNGKKKGTPIRKGKEVGLNLLLTTTSEGCDSVILVAWPMVILWFFVYKQ